MTLEAKPNFRALGKKFGKETPLAAAAVAALTSGHLRAFERGRAGDHRCGRHRPRLDAGRSDDRAARGGRAGRAGGARVFAAIDPTVTPELRRGGMARELVSRVQRIRKDTGLAVSDRIRLGSPAPDGAARR